MGEKQGVGAGEALAGPVETLSVQAGVQTKAAGGRKLVAGGRRSSAAGVTRKAGERAIGAKVATAAKSSKSAKVIKSSAASIAGKPASGAVASGRASRPNKRQMSLFLDALAESSNILASARAAGMTSSIFYRERRRNPLFAEQWHEALCEGFVRLETELLSEALVQPSGLVKDATLKARAQKYRLGLALLAAHRTAVRGAVRRGPSASVAETGDPVGGGEAKGRLAERLRNLQARGNGQVAADGDAEILDGVPDDLASFDDEFAGAADPMAALDSEDSDA